MSHNRAVEIDGMWIIERPDGTRVETNRLGGAFKSKAMAEAVIEYLETPKPVAPALHSARVPPRNSKENQHRKQLAKQRVKDQRELPFALMQEIAAKRGLRWTPEHGFEEFPSS